VYDDIDAIRMGMGLLLNLIYKSWLVLPFAFLTLSVTAVLVRLSHYYYVPHAIGSALDSFTQPGEIVWWLTLGGPFRDYPSSLLGFAVFIVANAAFWTAATICVAFGSSWVLAYLRYEKNDL
jgi:hypothetical protein